MNKKLYIVLTFVFFVFLTGFNFPNEENRDNISKLPDGTFIIDVSYDINDNQKVLALEDGILQFWVNQTMICEKEIPTPAEISIGNGFYEVIGNPYISEDGRLILIQSYTTPDGKLNLDYTVLADDCSEIIPSFAHNGYVFKSNEGKYGLVFYYDTLYPECPFEGFEFAAVDSDFRLPKPITIWLNESTVKTVNFGSWVSTGYGYVDVFGISARLDVESYGELDIANVCDSFEPVEVDDHFLNLLKEKFSPAEYNERFSKVIQTINEYQKNNEYKKKS